MNAPPPHAPLKLWQIDAIGVASCLLLGAAWYFAGVTPLSEARATREVLKGRIAESDDKLTESRALEQAQQRTAAALREELEGGQVRLVAVEHLNRRMAELNRLASEHGLRVDEVKPGAAQALPRFTTVPVQIGGAGSFAACARFLHAMHEQLRDVGVLGLELRGEPAVPDKTPTFTFNLVWYAAPGPQMPKK